MRDTGSDGGMGAPLDGLAGKTGRATTDSERAEGVPLSGGDEPMPAWHPAPTWLDGVERGRRGVAGEPHA